MWEQYVNVEGVAGSDEATKDYQLNLQLPSALWSFIMSSLFNCLAVNLTVLVDSQAEKAQCTLSAQRQTDTVSD